EDRGRPAPVQGRSGGSGRGDVARARVARQPVPPPPVHGDVARGAEPAAGAHRRGGGGTGDREPAVERDEVFPRASPYSRGGGRRGGLRARARDRPWNRDSAASAAQDLPQV